MRRTWLGALALFVATCTLTTVHSRPADLPYQGTWKLTIIRMGAFDELSLWLIKIDKDGKKAEVTGGYSGYEKSKVTELKADADGLRFTLSGPRGEFFIAAAPPKDKDKEVMLGTLRAGYDFMPLRIEKTELTELKPKKEADEIAGLGDLKAAFKQADPADKMKEIKDVLKTYENKPIAMIASQLLLIELMRGKADADAFKPIAATYFKTAGVHGREMQLQAAKLLSQLLVNYDKSVPLGLEYARRAAGLLKKDDNRGVQITTHVSLAQVLNKAGKKDAIKPVAAKIKEIAEVAVKNPRPGGNEHGVTMAIADMLLRSGVDQVGDVGLEFARRGLKMVKEDAPIEERLVALKLLRMGLFVRGKKDEQKTIGAEIEKIETKLDADFLKTAIPFKVEKVARKGKGNRVVLVELFTSANVPNCIAADIAFHAGLKAYSPKEAVFLQYHVPFPRAVPPGTLVNPDAAARAKFYDDIEAVPTVLVDGETTATPLGGSAAKAGETSYAALRKSIDTSMESDPEARIKLDVKRSGDKIDVSAKVDQLRETGATIKLRLVLVEEVVRYAGANRQRLHSNVVRAVLGGNDGFKLENKSSSHTASIDLAAYRKNLVGFLGQLGRATPFPNPERPMELKKLKVIALVQDDITRKIFQAAQADVPAAEEKKDDKKDDKKEEKKETKEEK